MALSTQVKSQFGAGYWKLYDGSGTPLVCAVQFDQADFSISDISPDHGDPIAYQTRRKLHSLRKGPLTFPTGSMTTMFSEFSESSVGTVIDFLMGTAGTPYASRVSTRGSSSEAVTTFKLELGIYGTNYGDASDEAVTFDDTFFKWGFSEGDPNTLTFDFTVYGDIGGNVSLVTPT